MRRGFTLVEIMIVVAIIALLATIGIPGLLRVRITANESAAQASLRAISTACETYASANDGKYPVSEAVLTGATPPYLNTGYADKTIQGYTYTYTTVADTGYEIAAAPAKCGTSGRKTYTIKTGGVLTSADCT